MKIVDPNLTKLRFFSKIQIQAEPNPKLNAWIFQSMKYSQYDEKLWYLDTCSNATWSNGHLVEWTLGRMDTWSNGHLVEWTLGRMDTWSNGNLIERVIWSNGHLVEWTLDRKGHLIEWTLGRMGIWSQRFYNYFVYSRSIWVSGENTKSLLGFYWDPMGSFKEVSAFGPHQHKDYLWTSLGLPLLKHNLIESKMNRR